jgi:hypothetical protein
MLSTMLLQIASADTRIGAPIAYITLTTLVLMANIFDALGCAHETGSPILIVGTRIKGAFRHCVALSAEAISLSFFLQRWHGIASLRSQWRFAIEREATS